MEKITTDISSFENLRKGGYVYVDKTDLLWCLAADRDGRQFFISRPRRFGKSPADFENCTATTDELDLCEADVKRHFRLFMEMLGAVRGKKGDGTVFAR